MSTALRCEEALTCTIVVMLPFTGSSKLLLSDFAAQAARKCQGSQRVSRAA